MSIDSTLASGRAAAEARMVDQIIFTRPGAGGPVFDSVTGAYVTAAGSTIYQGRCEVQSTGYTGEEAEVGGGTIITRQILVKIPYGAVGVFRGDVGVVAFAAHDGGLVGRQFRVDSFPASTFATARRIACEEVT